MTFVTFSAQKCSLGKLFGDIGDLSDGHVEATLAGFKFENRGHDAHWLFASWQWGAMIIACAAHPRLEGIKGVIP